MNDYLLYGIIALIVIIVLAIIFSYIIKNRQPKQIKADDIPLDINMLINAVGGKNNIKETTASSSRITFFVKDDGLVDLESLKTLGASGIVQTTNKVSAIFGKYSKEISNMINGANKQISISAYLCNGVKEYEY